MARADGEEWTKLHGEPASGMCPRPDTLEIGRLAPDVLARHGTPRVGSIQLPVESADEQFRVRDSALRQVVPGVASGSRPGLRVPVPETEDRRASDGGSETAAARARLATALLRALPAGRAPSDASRPQRRASRRMTPSSTSSVLVRLRLRSGAFSFERTLGATGPALA